MDVQYRFASRKARLVTAHMAGLGYVQEGYEWLKTVCVVAGVLASPFEPQPAGKGRSQRRPTGRAVHLDQMVPPRFGSSDEESGHVPRSEKG
jgi:hypothetical protein